MNPSAMRMGMPTATATAPQSGAGGAASIPAFQAKGALAAKLAALKAQGASLQVKGAAPDAQPQPFEGEIGLALADRPEETTRPNKAKRAPLTAKADAKTARNTDTAQAAIAPDASSTPAVKTRTGKDGAKQATDNRAGMDEVLNNFANPKPDPVAGSTTPGLERASAAPRMAASPDIAARSEKWKESVSNPEALRQSGKLQPREARAAELRADGMTSEEIRDVLRAEGLLGKRDPSEVEARERHDVNLAAPARPSRPASEPRAEKTARGAMNDTRPAAEGTPESRAASTSAAGIRDASAAALDAARTRVQELFSQTSPATTPAPAVAVADNTPSATPAAMPVHASAASATSADAPVNFAPLRDAPQASVLAELSARIAARLEAGRRVFDIRLDPPEMGTINVRLEFNGDGQMRAMLGADRVEALDLLRRDASELMRLMREAGIDLSGNGLSFSLEDGRNGAGQHRETHALLREQGFAPVRTVIENEIDAALAHASGMRALDITI